MQICNITKWAEINKIYKYWDLWQNRIECRLNVKERKMDEVQKPQTKYSERCGKTILQDRLPWLVKSWTK